MSASSRRECKHKDVRYECSDHAQEIGFKPRTALQRLAATLPSDKAPKKAERQRSGPSEDHYASSTFPAPLVLPNDELSYDPQYEPQSLKAWIEEPERNEVSPSRRTIYLVATPSIAPSVAYVKDWANPRLPSLENQSNPRVPRTEDILGYLAAFYHGMPVKMLTSPSLIFAPWSDPNPSQILPSSYIGLRAGSQVTGIRTRRSKDNFFAGQLNLNDLLDVAIDILPRDAYALLMLTNHDLYEDEDDDFCCGRAYGGSRVAVVSTARYNPHLDGAQDVETEHAWPASHCQAYIDTCCDSITTTKKKKKRGRTQKANQEPSSALHSAVKALSSITPQKDRGSSKLWLSRICKTASHELGHCFAMDHCVYYACIMQGTAGLMEDARQPPYLCPVDLAKVLRATGADSLRRYRALLALCEGTGEGDGMFTAFAAWICGRIGEVERLQREVVVID